MSPSVVRQHTEPAQAQRPIACRLRRGPDDAIENVLADINLAADASSRAARLIAGAGYRARTPDGAWLGRCLLHHDGVAEVPIVAFRAWLADA